MRDTQLTPKIVNLPNLTEEEQAQVDAARALAEWRERTKIGFLAALLHKGRPFTGVRKPKRKPTKHQRQIDNTRARSEFLATQGKSRKFVVKDA